MQALNYLEHPAQSGTAKNMVILLHGLGSNAEDLMGLVPHFAPHMPDTLFISPDAPDACDFGGPGFQWFSLQDRHPDKMRAGLETAAPILNHFIDQMSEKYDVSNDKIAVVGFSQGTMMTFYTMPQRKNACACLVGFSGLLFESETLKDKEGLSKMPVLVIHGEQDDVVDVEFLDKAYEGFAEAGFEVEALKCPETGHWIDPLGLNRSIAFLNEHLS